MSSERYRRGTTIPFEARFEDANGDPVLNATGVVIIRRKSDDKFFNGISWQAASFELAMAEVNETNAPGYWKGEFDSSKGNNDDEYVVEIKDTSGNSVNKLEKLFWYVGAYLNIVEDMVIKILGLTHENFVLEPLEFTGDIMTKGVIRLYDSKANAETDNPNVGLLAQYNIDSPHNGNRLIKYTSTLAVSP